MLGTLLAVGQHVRSRGNPSTWRTVFGRSMGSLLGLEKRFYATAAEFERIESTKDVRSRINCRDLHGTATYDAGVETEASWVIVRRPIAETVVKNYARYGLVVQPLILHGPRGVGKRTVLEGLMTQWKRSPHVVAYLDLSNQHHQPWMLCGLSKMNRENSGKTSAEKTLRNNYSSHVGSVRASLEGSLESLALKAIEMGCLKSDRIFDVLREHYAVDGALRQFLRLFGEECSGNTEEMWNIAVQRIRKAKDGQAQRRSSTDKSPLGLRSGAFSRSNITSRIKQNQSGFKLSMSQIDSKDQGYSCLALAQELLQILECWRRPSGSELNRKATSARVAADAATSWPALLLRLISASVQEGKFQPKLVINNLDLMRTAPPESSRDCLHGALYHDSLLKQVSRIGYDEGCIPIMLTSSDSHYSLKIFEDRGDENIFISQEMLGWTPNEAKVHLVPAVFEDDEWNVITSVLGPNVRHLRELHAVWHNLSFLELMEESSGNVIEDCIDLYLGYLQVIVVDPAMEAAIAILEKFAGDVATGKSNQSYLKHGVPWQCPPLAQNKMHGWARCQLIDYVQALAATDFVVNHREEKAQEFLDDPLTDALLQVGLLYQQREPPYLRPISRGVARCILRWHVRETLNFTLSEQLQYIWHRITRGRYYRQLIVK